MAAHRYWRVRFNPQSGTQGRCGELEMRTSIGGSDVTGSGMALASTVNGSNVASNAFDDSTTTYWESTNAAQVWWIGYDFGSGSPQDIVEIAWTAHSGSLERNPREWWLEWSDDNTNWTTVAYDNFLAAWTSGLTRVMDTTVGSAEVAGLDAVGHSAQNPNARVHSLTPTGHSAQNPNARVSGIWAEVHASIAAEGNAIVNGMWAELHVSLANDPLDTLPVRPNTPVVERLSWLTDVIQNYDGTDQRIQTRYKPRREFTFDMSLLNDTDYKRAYDIYFHSAGRAVHAPLWGYSATVKSNAAIGALDIYCNTFRGDFRKNDPVLITAMDGTKEVYHIQDVYADRIRLGRPLKFAVKKGALITPCPRSRFAAAPSFDMNSIAGTSNVTLRAERPRTQEAWPDMPVTLPTFDGYVLVDERPTNASAGHAFDKNVEIIDNQTGIEKYVTSWKQSYAEGSREYMVNTIWDWPKLQFWRTLFDYCCGRQRAFLTPTYRNDLVPVTLTTTQIIVEGSNYDKFYKNRNTYRRLQIETGAGIVNVKSDSVSVNGDGNTVITFTQPVSSAIASSTVKRVSYLVLSRLGGDSVTITHHNSYATISTSLRAASE